MEGQAAMFAPWSRRVAAAVIDYFGLLLVAEVVGHLASHRVGRGLTWVALVWGLINAWLAGRTGQSIGKRFAGITLVNDDFHGLVGGFNAVLRVVGHVVDILPLFMGFLAPIWDPKRRCFDDMLMKTVVLMGPPSAVLPAGTR